MEPLLSTGKKIADTSLAAKISVPDWRLLNEDQPFYNKTTNQYCITVATESNIIDEEIVERERLAARKQGIRNLFLFYNKKPHEEHGGDIEQFIDAHLEFASSEEWHLDPRPCSRLRFLVCVDANKLDALPSKPTEWVKTIPKDEVKKIARYKASELASIIEFCANSFDTYASEMFSAAGNSVSPDLNMNIEASRLRRVMPALKKMLFFNDLILDKDSEYVIQFGFGDGLELLHVAIQKDVSMDEARVLKIGFETFKQGRPIKFPRTRGYLSNLGQIKERLSCPEVPGWYEFVTEFSHGAVHAIDKFTNSRRGRQIMNDISDLLEKKPIKTRSEVMSEDEKLSNAAKREQAEKREKESDFVGDFVLSSNGLDQLLNEVETFEDAFVRVLNKIDLKWLTGLAGSLIASQLPQEDVREALFKASLKALDIVELNNVANKCFPNRPEEVQAIFDNIEELCPDTGDKIAQDLAAKFEELPQEERERCIELDCPIPPRLFGWRGIVEDYISDRIVSLIDYDSGNLCATSVSQAEPADSQGWPSWEIPTISFPDLPTIDIMGGIYIAIKTAVIQALNEMIVAMIKAILTTLIRSLESILCNYDDISNFGAARMKDIIEQAGDNALDVFKDTLYDFGINPDMLEPDPIEGEPSSGRITDFMEGASDCLNPGELISALKGEELGNNVSVLEGLSTEHFGDLLADIDIMDIMAAVGIGIDFGAAGERLRKNVADNLCDEFELPDPGLRNLLDGRATPGLIDEIIQKRRGNLADQLDDLTEMLGTPIEDLLKNVLPPMDCEEAKKECNLTGNKREPIVPRDPPSVASLNKLVMDTMLDGVQMQFDQEASNFSNLLVKTETRKAEEGDLEWEIAATDEDKEQAEKIILAVLPGLRGALKRKDNFNVGGPIPIDRDNDGFDDERAGMRISFNFPVANLNLDLGQLDIEKIGQLQIEVEEISNNIGDIREELGIVEARDDVHDADLIITLNRRIENLIIKRTEKLARIDRLAAQLGEDPLIQLDPTTAMTYDSLVNSIRGGGPDFLLPDGLPVPEPNPSDAIKDVYQVALNQLWDIPGDHLTINNEDVDNTAPNLKENVEEKHNAWMGFLSNMNSSVQQDLFALLMVEGVTETFERYTEHVDNPEPPSLEDLGVDPNAMFGLASFFQTDIYFHIVQAIIGKITRPIANSKIFDLNRPDGKGLDGLNLVPDLPPKSFDCGEDKKIREGLMRVTSTKKQALEEYYSSDCAETPAGEPGPFESAGLNAASKLMIRIHVIEIMLRNLFTLSRFKFDEIFSNDGLMRNFVEQLIEVSVEDYFTSVGDLGINYDQYKLQLRKYLKEKLERVPEDPPIDVEALSDQEVFQHVLKEEADFIIKKIQNMMAELYPKDRHDNIKDWIMLNIPQFDVPEASELRGLLQLHMGDLDEDGVPDFGGFWSPPNFPYGTSEMPRPERDDFAPPLPAAFEISDEPDEPVALLPSHEDLFESNGGLVFERILIIKPKPFAQMPQDHAFSQHLRDNTVPGEHFRGSGGGRAIAPFDRPAFFNDNRGQEPIKVVRNVNEFREWYNAIIVETYGGGEAQPVRLIKRAIEASIAARDIRGQRVHRLKDYFEVFQYGLRLAYVFPPHLPQPARGLFVGAAPGGFHEREGYVEASKRAKTFRTRVRVFANQDGLEQYVDVASIPLITEAISLQFLTLKDFFGNQYDVNGKSDMELFGDWGFAGNERGEAILNDMMHNHDLEMFFDFCIPLSRLLSLISIYCMYASGMIEERLNSAFTGTKHQIMMLLNALQPDEPIENFYKYNDPQNEERGGNTGTAKNANNSTTTKGPTSEPNMAYMAAMTIPIMIKGLAEQFDPSYSLMDKLDMLGILPHGKTTRSLPYVLPINLGGFGPPLTPLGAAALAMPELPGERKRSKERRAGGPIDDQDRFCVEEEEE